MKPMNFDKLYELRHEFMIIGLTGRTGAGCTKTAEILSKSFADNEFEEPQTDLLHNNQRKYKIIYKFAKENYKKFVVLKYRHFITSFILEHDIDELVKFLKSCAKDNAFEVVKPKDDFENEVREVKRLSEQYGKMQVLVSSFNEANKVVRSADEYYAYRRAQYNAAYELFFNPEYNDFSDSLHKALETNSPAVRKKLMEVICNNLRRTGCIYGSEDTALENVYRIAERINIALKAHREKSRTLESTIPTRVVIDAFRNPLEIMFFKERYSAFLMFAIHIEEDETKLNKLAEKYNREQALLLQKLDEGEYQSKRGQFWMQDVHECIQKSDVHIHHHKPQAPKRRKGQEATKEDKTALMEWASSYSTEQQILLYTSLFMQPGLVTPSPQERCMQMAFTAKYNSGCISRQVGAVVTNEHFSIKAVGWNNTPEGHVPCLLRSADDLLNEEDEEAFSAYERNDPEFTKHFKEEYGKRKETELKGHSCPFCFKSYHNSLKEGKNQVHTRSLHAEENAFLQIAKDGGQAIANGKLFTSASPCELCAKKAYQLGIKTVYYIDPYPGISKSHILDLGQRSVEMKLFNGAIGRAYHKLYEPFMAYKDELNLRMGLDIQDKATQLKNTINRLSKQLTDNGITPNLEG
jgi:dCMP deaminase